MSGAVDPFPRERFLAFCEQLRILTKDFGLIPMRMLGTQTYVLDELCAGVADGVTTFYFLKARQLGLSTFFLALDIFWAMENAGLLASFATHEEKSKAVFRNVLKVFFANLPKQYKIRWDLENRDMVSFQNTSLIQYLVAGTKEKIKGGLGRSSANNYVHATETAFWGAPDDLNELAATFSSHYRRRLWIEETTANGFNFWEQRWREAEDDPTVRRVFVGWWRHDHYRYDKEHPYYKAFMPEGEDTPLHIIERMRRDRVAKRYGIIVDREQIAWYRWMLETRQGGDQSKMDELYPWLPEDAFVATGAQYFTNVTLTQAQQRARNQPFLAYKYSMSNRWQDTMVMQVKQKKRAELRIWEEATPYGYYSIGCDPAYGSSEEADRAVICVARVFADKLVQVAEFVSPVISTYQCAWALAHLCGYYGARDLLLTLEINGPGEAVFNELRELRHKTAGAVPEKGEHDLRKVFANMRHFLYQRTDSMRGELAFQWRTNSNNKPPMMAHFKDAFELKHFVLNSMPLLEEMQTTIIDGGNVTAESGKKDDRVIAAALAHEGYRRKMKRRLEAIGETFQQAYERSTGQEPDAAKKMVLNYLRSQNIVVETKH